MAKKKSVKKKRIKKSNDKKTYAFLATFFSILGFIIALLMKKNDKYVMFYAKQSLLIFVAYIISLIIAMIPRIGLVLGPIAYLIVFILWVISWVYALSGKTKEIPILGEYAKKINF